MKNLKSCQIIKSAILSMDEFEEAVKSATGCNVVPVCDIYGIHYTGSSEFYDAVFEAGFEDEEEYIKHSLSEYFDIEITSIHMDDCDYSGIWIAFKDISIECIEELSEENIEL